MATSPRVTVTTDGTLLATGGPSGSSFIVRNDDAAADLFVGQSGLTVAANSYRLKADRSLSVELSPGEEFYGIVASGSVIAHTIKTRG